MTSIEADFFEACRRGNKEEIENLYEAHPGIIDIEDVKGFTPLIIAGKRIFATLHEESETANIKFSPADQSVYSLIDKKAIYPVNNKWGLQGWTTFQLARVDKQLMLDALNTAYNEVLKTKKK